MSALPATFDDVTASLAARIRAAAAQRASLRICGGGSKDFTGPPRTGEALSTRALQGILSYEPSELVVTVGAGTPLAELEAALAQQGQYLPFEPPQFARSQPAAATVGGMLASGLAGPARASVGGVRDYVLGLQMINGQGEVLRFGGQVMKNVAGYDVSRLMVGAWGSLGLVTEVSLKVLPRAPAEATLVFALAQGPALECLHRWGAQPLPLNASCWLHDPESGADRLYVRLRGAAAAVEAACRTMLADADGQRMDSAQAAADWALCRDQALPFFTPPGPQLALWRLSLPPTAPVLALEPALAASPLMEWHGGLRWLWAPMSAAEHLQRAARAVAGHAECFFAPPGTLRNSVALWQHGTPAQAAIAQRLRNSFDPHGVFNRPA